MDENNIVTNPIDTSAFVPYTPAPDIDGANKGSFFNNAKLTEFKDPQTPQYIRTTQFDLNSQLASLTNGNKSNSIDSMVSAAFPNKNKLDLTTTVDIRDTHEVLSNGTTWIPKYKNYLAGSDNDTRLAMQQTDTEKFINPIKRFVANTSKAPLDLIGSVYGIGAAAFSGRFDAIYDNDYMHWVDDWTLETNNTYKNYYTEAQRDQNLGLNLQTFDKVLGGAEFTSRLLAAEAILAVATGGTSLTATAAKTALSMGAKISNVTAKGSAIAKALKFLRMPELLTAAKVETSAARAATSLLKESENIAESVISNTSRLNKAASRGQIADALVKTRFAVTSPLYEAGFEARHFEKDAKDQFWNFYREKGVDPTVDEINAFSDNLSGSANGVFALNMGILAPSNLAMMGNVLDLSNPFARAITSSGKGVSERLFGMGVTKAADGTFKALKPTLTQKVAAYIAPVIKGGLTEGVYEEGGQGIASSTFKNYVASSYNPKYAKTTANYIDAFGTAFADQFGTKEGREEMIIGGLIGGLFGIGGAVRGGNSISNQYKKQERTAEVQNLGKEFIDGFKSDAYTNEWNLSLFSQGNRFQKIQENLNKAEQSGDKLAQAQTKAESFMSMIEAYHSVGKEQVFVDNMSSTIAGLDPKMIADSTGLSLEEVQDYKNEQIQNIEEMSTNYGKALKAGRYIFGNKLSSTVRVGDKDTMVSGELMASALAFSSTMANFNERFAMQSYDAIQTKILETAGGRELSERMGAVYSIQSMSTAESNQYYNLNGQSNTYKSQITKLTNQINKLQGGEQTEASVAKILELGKLLGDAQTNLLGVNEKADALFRASTENFYGKMGKTGFGTRIELDNFSDIVEELNKDIENLKLDSSDKIMLEKLFDQFNKANNAHKSFLEMSNNIQSKEFTPKYFRGMFGGLRAKFHEKSINEHTKTTLEQIFEASQSEEFARNAREIYAKNKITDNKLDDEYKATKKDYQTIVDKLGKEDLNENEQKFYDKFKEEIDLQKEESDAQVSDPKSSKSDKTDISQKYIDRTVAEKELEDLQNGEYSEEVQGKIDALQTKISDLENKIDEIENNTPDTPVNDSSNKQDSEIENLNQEIENLEKEIEGLETSKEEFEARKKRTVEVNKITYRQYTYVKPNGETITGNLEVNKGILQIVNEDEIVDIQETNDEYLRGDLSKIKGLTELEDPEIIIEGKEVYVNGKLYNIPNGNIDENISKDENGNYEVKVKAKNGRMVTLKGNVADAIVYENLLNKIETDEQAREATSRSERDGKIEKKYEELDSKTKNRDSRVQKIEKDRIKAEKERKNEEDRIEAEKEKSKSDIYDEIEELENQKDDVIIDRQVELEDELAELEGEIDFNEKITRLKDQVEELRKEQSESFDLIEEEVEDKLIKKVKSNEQSNMLGKMITKLELEITKLERERKETPFNENGTPSEQLDWIVKNIPEMNFETVDEASNFTEPSQEDVNEYRDLINTKNRNSTKNKRMAELREKLSPWFIADGLSLDGINILDVIELYNQSKNMKDIADTQDIITTQEELTSSINKVDMSNDPNAKNSENVSLTYDGVYMSKHKDGFKVSHLKLSTILLASLQEGQTPVVEVFEKDEKGKKKLIFDVEVTYSNYLEVSQQFDNKNGIEVKLSEDVKLKKGESDSAFILTSPLNDFVDMMKFPVFKIKGQSTGYNLMYEKQSDGTYAPKESEYQVVRDGNELPFNKEVTNSLKAGDTVTLEFDPLDEYNKTLNKTEYADKANIYVKKNGELVQILKASDRVKADAKSDLKAIRAKVVKGKPIKVEIKDSYLGLPIIMLDNNMNAIEIPLDETNVLGYGYVDENGDLQGDIANLDIDNKQYALPQSKGKKAPMVAFKSNGKIIVFPINLKPQGIDLSGDVDIIMNDNTISKQQKMLKINSMLEEHGMFTPQTALTNINFDVNTVKQALTTVYESIDITDSNQIKAADKTAYINLKDPFMNSKLLLDLSKETKDSLDASGSATQVTVKQTVKSKDKSGLASAVGKLC